jgi:hypothetical protein
VAGGTDTSRLLAGASVAGSLLTLVATVGWSTRSVAVGSREGGWVYPYVRSFSAEILVPFVLVFAVALGLLALSRRTHERFEWATVAVWLIAGVPLQLLLRWHAPATVAAIVTSDRANSFYSPTLRYGAGEFLAQYEQIVGTLPQHARSNMAGKTMLYFWLRALADSPAALGVLVIALATVGALLAYVVARDWLEDRRAGLFALVLYLVVPGRIFFAPILNVVSPVPILLALWLHVRFLTTRRWLVATLIGPALYVTTFFEPLPLVMGLVFLAMLVVAIRRGQVDGATCARLAAMVVATFVACDVLMRVTFGYDLFANVAWVLDDAVRFNDRARRPYGIWVVQNVADFAAGAGLASLVLVIAGTWVAVRTPGHAAWPAAALALSGLSMVAVVDLIGVNRGETVRLWIFLAAFLQLVPAWLCARSPRAWPFVAVLGLTALQAAVGVGMVGFVMP